MMQLKVYTFTVIGWYEFEVSFLIYNLLILRFFFYPCILFIEETRCIVWILFLVVSFNNVYLSCIFCKFIVESGGCCFFLSDLDYFG